MICGGWFVGVKICGVKAALRANRKQYAVLQASLQTRIFVAVTPLKGTFYTTQIKSKQQPFYFKIRIGVRAWNRRNTLAIG